MKHEQSTLTIWQSNEAVHALLQSAPIAIVNRAGTILFANPQLEALFGYGQEELFGNPVEILIPGHLRDLHVAHRQEYTENVRVRAMGSGIDLVGAHKDGREIPVEAGLSYIRQGDELLIIGSITDSSHRKEIERTLEARVEQRTLEIERRRSVAEGLRYILAVLNSHQTLDKTLEYTVHQACRLMDADGCALFELYPHEGTLAVSAQFGLAEGFFTTGRPDSGEIPFPIGETTKGESVLTQQYIAISNIRQELANNEAGRKRQQTLLINGYAALLSVRILIRDTLFGGMTLYYSTPRDFSAEDIQLAVTFADHAALAIENARMRSQIEESAVKGERNRIARDLHDSVTQTLFSATLLAEVLPQLQTINPPEALKRAEELRELTRGALAEMRALLLELRPAQLDAANIQELYQQLRDAIQARARIPVKLTLDGNMDIDGHMKSSLYYIAQEALNNVAKHAEATSANLYLSVTPKDVTLVIEDDGVGFDPQSVTPEHMGVGIMRERAAELNTELRIESELGQGTKVIVHCLYHLPA